MERCLGGRIIAVARDDLSDEQYRSLIQSRFDSVDLAKRPSAEEFAQFAALLQYLRMDLSKTEDYQRLAELLNARGGLGGDVCGHAPACSPTCANRSPPWA